MSAKKLDPLRMKQIAAWKSTHPDMTLKDLSKLFEVSEARVRYALQKYSDFALMQNTKKGRQIVGSLISDVIREEDVIKNQISTILSELETSTDMVVSTRLKLMNEYLTLKNKVTALTLQKHLKSIDADLIARIIRRFKPSASNEDIIKIFNEELAKAKNE